MTNESVRKDFFPLIALFLVLSLIFLLARFLFPGSGIDYRVLLIGNGLLFIVGFISMRMNAKAMEHKNVQVFLRLMYGSFIMKFFVLATCAFIYIAVYKKNINKPALFGCFGLYFIYTVIEIRSVMKQRKKPNA